LDDECAFDEYIPKQLPKHTQSVDSPMPVPTDDAEVTYFEADEPIAVVPATAYEELAQKHNELCSRHEQLVQHISSFIHDIESSKQSSHKETYRQHLDRLKTFLQIK
jgi:hypothetical protein